MNNLQNPANISQILEEALGISSYYLNLFASDPNFDEKMVLAFGNSFNTENARKLAQDWLGGDFSVIPPIEIRDSAEINGANGAFAGDKNRIYLSREFLIANADNVEAVANVLLEEIGHAVDWELNSVDGLGDEGAIFSHLVRGDVLSEEYLQELRVEDDWATVSLDGELVAIEQVLIEGTAEDDHIYSANYSIDGETDLSRFNDRIYGYDGDDYIDGGHGDDYIDGGHGNDNLFGGAGEYNGNDTIYGGDGHDYLVSGVGYNDSLYGGNGSDHLIGTYSGSAYLDGGGGDDRIEVSAQDTGYGREGNDVMVFGYWGSNAKIDGGEGYDLIKVNANLQETVGLTIDLVEGKVSATEGLEDTITNFEYIVGSEGDDSYFVSAATGSVKTIYDYQSGYYSSETDTIVLKGDVFSLTNLTPDQIGFGTDSTDITPYDYYNITDTTHLIIDLNKDGVADRNNDLVIRNFFASDPSTESGFDCTESAGSGFIPYFVDDEESVSELAGNGFIHNFVDDEQSISGYDILKLFCNQHADLSVTKSDSADPINVGDTLTYTIEVINNGPGNATDVTLTEELPETVTFESASQNPSLSLRDDSFLMFDMGSLASGETKTVTIDVIPTEAGIITNEASVSGAGDAVDDPNPDNNIAEITTEVIAVADLEVKKSDSADPVNVGDTLTYTIEVTNNGPGDATDVTLTEDLPESVTFKSASLEPEVRLRDDSFLQFDMGSLASGETKTVTIDVIPTQAGIITNEASVSGAGAALDDPNPDNDVVEEETKVEFELAVNTNGDQPDADPNDGVPDVDLTKEGLQITLRSAIEYANQNPGKDTVTFKIPAGNSLTIKPKSALPTITESVVIDGNSQPGINIDGSQAPVDTNGLTITGNDSIIKGLTIKGFQASENYLGGSGIVIQSSNNLIENNNVENNGASGVSIVGNITNNQIKENEIFNNALNGVFISGSNQNKIENNSIYGNEDGIDIRNSNSNEIYGNKIGETATVYNRFNGIKIVNGNNNKIGDVAAGKGNTIAFNQNSGLSIASGVGNSIRGNSIFGNGMEGIDLNDNNELDVNDNGDTDTGANQLQNYPVLTSVKPEKDFVSFKGNINGLPKQVYQLDFFAQQQVDSEQIYLGSFSVETDDTGNVNSEIEEIDGRFNAKNRYIKGFEVSFATDFNFSEDTIFTATATDFQGNTSEFFPWDYFYDLKQSGNFFKSNSPARIEAEFFPNTLKLSETLNHLGLTSFNWLQSVKHFPDELDLEFWLNPQTTTKSVQTLDQNVTGKGKIKQEIKTPSDPNVTRIGEIKNIQTPFIDPVVGSNNYFVYRKGNSFTAWAQTGSPIFDDQIFYWASEELSSYTENDLTFYFDDTPQQPVSVFPTDGYIEFETRLVGVDAQGNYIDWDGLGTNFTWKSNTVFSGDVLGNKVVEGGIFDVKIEGKQSNKFPVEAPVIKNNYLNGSSAPDKLVGGEGNDTLIGGGGKDTLNGGNDNDTYQLNAKTAKGSQIIDSHGNDVLILEGWGEGNTIIDRKGKDLIIDLNQDGKANPQEDLTIKNFFDDSKTNKPGKGFIETVKNVATGTEIKGEEIINAVTNQNKEETKNDKDDDTYKFNANNAKGAKIADSKGEDILKLDKTNISLTGLAKGKTGFAAKGKDLIIDINKDGKANAKQDLTIKNFFANNKTKKPGKGFIETVDNVTGEEIIDSLTNPNQGITKNGNKRNNTLRGGKLDDVLNGKGGNDKLFGNNGNDKLIGGSGKDTLNGGNGNDTYQLNAKNSQGSQIIDSGGNDILELKGANISLKGLAKGKTGVERKGKNLIIDINQDGKANAKQDLTIKNFFANGNTDTPGKGFIETVDNVTGEEIIDSLTNPNQGITKNGNKRNNTLRGGKLDDVLNGKGGNDKLLGNNGNDTLTGGNGKDQLNGGKGEDVLTGGNGKDSFIFTHINKTETDEITDFVLGEDKIILDKSAFKAIKSRKGNSFSRKREFAIVDDAAEVASSKAFIVYNEESGELFYNPNGKKAGLGSGGLFAKLEGAPDISARDFTIQL